MDPFIGEIRAFPWGWAPTGWALCNGQLLPVQRYQALFALLGTNFGGDGRTTFGLPDLCGRAPLAIGPAPDGVTYALGIKGGIEGVVLDSTTTPPHTHTLNESASVGDQAAASANYLAATAAQGSAGLALYASASTAVTPLASDAISTTGASVSHNNMQPFLALNFCIATNGLFPPRQ